MLYTRKGDNGTSGLFGTKERYPKTHPVYEALGTIDELNSLLGICRAEIGCDDKSLKYDIKNVQECLFVIQAELAGAEKHLSASDVSMLEHAIERMEHSIENLDSFVIPGTTKRSALFDFVRTIARRTERRVLAAIQYRHISEDSQTYLNRLSSFFYALARYNVHGETEPSPSYLER
jgi:cob(I)alamin adenosyltransferase